MKEPTKPGLSEEALANASREEIMSALFAHMVIQHGNMALMLLGKIPNPETNEFSQDIEAAKSFIDQLEMLEFKTKGNLTADEEALLKESLTVLRLAFVEAIEGHPQPNSSPVSLVAAPARSEKESQARIREEQ